MHKLLKPAIRFKEFTNDWEQHKFNELLIKIVDKGHPNMPTLTASVTGDVFRRIDTGYTVSVSNASLMNYVRVLKNDFILHLSSFRSGLAFSDFDGITSPAYIVLRLIGQNVNNPKYWKHFFRTEAFIKSLVPFTYGLRVGKTINLDELNYSILNAPSFKEQTKIASLLESIFSSITLHQRKLEKLKNIKNMLLEKMFADEKNLKPAIRFKEFTNDWEQRRLGDMCIISTGKLDANAMDKGGKYNFYTSGVEIYKINRFAFSGEAITIAGNGANVGYMHLAEGQFNAYQRTYVLQAFSENRIFLNYAIKNALNKKIQEEVRGSGIPYIVLDMLNSLNLNISSKNEQQKISNTFLNLDSLITLHQRKLEKLKNIKNMLLEKMFVNA
ncbi:restriction endonuclease subunit S [Mycoplasmopsis bovigenitalium]|uniref:restriction endonuclease subunit S n=1 Tax=Mycoplasmopsis bovigenitalium TaxID=2112 RepID=UPI00090A4EDC|nr:restriction endonuclease subunit S [Mycoplasmopsis bovigenitalium]BAW18119.1 restriction endonuclease subunit S [Mycoplasmopsis bovigenitalium]